MFKISDRGQFLKSRVATGDPLVKGPTTGPTTEEWKNGKGTEKTEYKGSIFWYQNLINCFNMPDSGHWYIYAHQTIKKKVVIFINSIRSRRNKLS